MDAIIHYLFDKDCDWMRFSELVKYMGHSDAIIAVMNNSGFVSSEEAEDMNKLAILDFVYDKEDVSDWKQTEDLLNTMDLGDLFNVHNEDVQLQCNVIGCNECNKLSLYEIYNIAN